MSLKKHTTLAILLILVSTLNAYAQSPFGDDIIVLDEKTKPVSLTSTAIQPPTDQFPCQGNVNCKWLLNVRQGPWGKVIDGYRPGTKVEVLRQEGDWYIIKRGDGIAYVHTALIDIPGTPATQGPRQSPYETAEKKKGNVAKKKSNIAKKTPAKQTPAKKSNKTGGINGPEIPATLLNGLTQAKKTKWFTTKDKCLQFAGTIVYKAGAKVKQSNSIYPHLAYKPDKSLRGSRISTLGNAAKQGKLKPGMLIHVKAAYDKDPAYNPVENAHHWFVYMGMKNGVPMFADNLRKGRLQTIEEINRNMSAGRILKSKYKNYGNIRRVSAIYDPFADQR